MLLYLAFCFNIISTMHQVGTDLYAGRNGSTFRKRFRMSSFLSHMSYIIVLVAIYIAYVTVTGSTIAVEYPKLTSLAYGGEFLQACLRTMVSNVTHENFNPYRRSTLFNWVLFSVNAASFLSTGSPLINELWMILAINAMAWGTIVHYIYFVLKDFKRVLGIRVFHIPIKTDA